MSPHSPTSPAAPLSARFAAATLLLLALSGGLLSFGRGGLPHREAASPAAAISAEDQLAPDLALYCEVIAEVRGGRGYYDTAHENIQAHGFPVSSPLNWRLPTYAWLFAALPCLGWIQLALIALSIVALSLAFLAESRSSSVGQAALLTFLLFGVVKWSIDGYAFLAQEPWAATFILISLSAYRLAGNPQSEIQNPKSAIAWRSLAIAAAFAALAFRELALPYCGIACLVALYRCRWLEAAAWTLGIAAFFAFFCWHVQQVNAQLAGTEVAASAGLSQWLRLGGLDFVLLTTRMNALLFAAPSWLLWLYLLAALVGLAHRQDDASRLACLSALAYLLVFAFLGRPENFYWGLLAAPLLPWGMIHAPVALKALTSVRSAHQPIDGQSAAKS